MNRKSIDQIVCTAAVAVLFIGGTPLRAVAFDQSFEAALKQTYVYRTYLKDDDIKVATEDGVVTLTGTVADKSNWMLAQDTAKCLPGVVRVDNQLETKADEDAGNTDESMSRKVNLALRFRRNASVANTTVVVENGIVTLTGTATSNDQRVLAGKFASDIEGVVAVMNRMTVIEPVEPAEPTQDENPDDASTTAMVRSALLAHRSINKVNMHVVTRNGIVMLTGLAGTDAEKELATELVGNINGVISVNNEMTIQVSASK